MSFISSYVMVVARCSGPRACQQFRLALVRIPLEINNNNNKVHPRSHLTSGKNNIRKTNMARYCKNNTLEGQDMSPLLRNIEWFKILSLTSRISYNYTTYRKTLVQFNDILQYSSFPLSVLLQIFCVNLQSWTKTCGKTDIKKNL